MKYSFAILAVAGLAITHAAGAEELTVWGSAFGEIKGIPQLAFHPHDFTATTKNGIGYFTGTNSLGTFSLAAIGPEVSGTFTLQLSLSAPSGLRGSPALAKKSAITAKITKDEQCGGVWIHFSSPASRVIFDTGSINGSFTMTLADVTVKQGQTAPLLAMVKGEQQSDVPCPLHFSGVMAKPVLLQPATQKMTPVWLKAAVSDNAACQLSCKIVSVSSNEAVSQGRDWEITGDLTLNLRAARDPDDAARIYSVAVECSDIAGNKVIQKAPVAVPGPRGR